jgi:aryl-alcohol dehydrogenase-like predicted oxidoreductase
LCSANLNFQRKNIMNTPAKLHQLEATPTTASAIGLGCMGMSAMYGASDDATSIGTIHAALDAGINLFDTGDFYGSGHNEMLIAKALEGQRHRAQLSVKFGALRSPDGGWTGVDGRPQAVKNFLAYSLKRLNTDHIDIYRLARLDPNVPIEDTIGAIADMVKAGYVGKIGLSEVGVDTIRRAHQVHAIADLQIEYSLLSRGPEATLFPALRELNIGVTAYGVLSRGLLSGSKPTGPADFRAYLPRFNGEALIANQKLVKVLNDIAASIPNQPQLNATHIAIAWVLAKAKQQNTNIMPIIGSRTPAQLAEALHALKVSLSAEDMVSIEAAIPTNAVMGSRYSAEHMAGLDSEK